MKMSGLRAGFSWLFWNAHERRLRLLPRLALGMMLIVLLYLLLSWVANRVLSDAVGRLWGVPGWVAVQGLSQFLAIFLGILLAVRLLDRRPLVALGFHFGRGWWPDLAFGLTLGALLMAGIFLAEWVAGWVTITGILTTGPNSPSFPPAFAGAVVLFICVGFYEELFARGYILRNLAEGLCFRPLRARGGVVLAWLLSSLAFSLAHLGNPHAGQHGQLDLGRPLPGAGLRVDRRAGHPHRPAHHLEPVPGQRLWLSGERDGPGPAPDRHSPTRAGGLDGRPLRARGRAGRHLGHVPGELGDPRLGAMALRADRSTGPVGSTSTLKAP
jgi:membrane protease YdiL (CAAX protease family)